ACFIFFGYPDVLAPVFVDKKVERIAVWRYNRGRFMVMRIDMFAHVDKILPWRKLLAARNEHNGHGKNENQRNSHGFIVVGGKSKNRTLPPMQTAAIPVLEGPQVHV